MTKKGLTLGVLGLAVLGSIAIAASTFAYRGDMSQMGPNYTPERHAQMEKAFENGDYNAWKELMNSKGRVSEVVNENNFSRFAEMHRFMEDGNIEEANKIRAELGLGQGQGRGQNGGNRGQNRNGNFADANNDGICDRMQ